MDGRVILSGCSGGGKSTLLAALGARDFATVEEPGRRIVREEQAAGGHALPWVDLAAFAERALAKALADHAAADPARRWSFFDRSWIDAAAALDALDGGDRCDRLGPAHRYHPRVFLVPPWPEIHVADAERRHGLDEAIAEYERLCAVYPRLGYEVVVIPKASVEARVGFVLERL